MINAEAIGDMPSWYLMGIDTFKGDKLFLPSSEKGSLLKGNDLLPLVSTDFRIRNVLGVQEIKQTWNHNNCPY